jgi:murein DD-endopeptidase MepM/ murein hydrolase activator NlpD
MQAREALGRRLFKQIWCSIAISLALCLFAHCPLPIDSARAAQTSNNHQIYKLESEAGIAVEPMSVVRVQDDLYFLEPNSLWYCAGAKKVIGGPDVLVLRHVGPPGSPIDGVPCQEFNDFIYFQARQCLLVLDKSGDIFSYFPADQSWRLFRRNGPSVGAPDPDYISLCAIYQEIGLLDPERNLIWKVSESGLAKPCFREVLPWRVRQFDPYVADGLAIAFGDQLYLLRRRGAIAKIAALTNGSYQFVTLPYQRPVGLRPSRFVIFNDGTKYGIYLVERENNRVVKIDSNTGKSSAFIFPTASSLRNLVTESNGFWILNGNYFLYRANDSAVAVNAHTNPRGLEATLRGFQFPISGQSLPTHPGVLPGARRLYRYGVHEGLDIFGPLIGTPVHAAKDGVVIRCDSHFVDMTAGKLAAVMEECRREHRTSEKNEDLFRGCQVWIDHGQGVVSRYAHLNAVNPNLKLNQHIKAGQILGFVGVSGTGQNLPGKAKYPHLHFEIRIKGKYVGWGLTPQETLGVYEDIFGKSQY